MFGHDAVILDRHPIAGEFDHAAALRAVPGVERQGRRFDRNFFIFAHIALPSLTRQGAARCRPVPCPLCHGNLRVFLHAPLSGVWHGVTPSVVPAETAGTLSRVSVPACAVLLTCDFPGRLLLRLRGCPPALPRVRSPPSRGPP